MKLLISIISLILAISLLVFIIRRALKDKKVWRQREPEVREFVEQKTGQGIIETLLVGASSSKDLRIDFFLWLAFTSDYVAYVMREQAAREDEGRIGFSRKNEVSIKMLKDRKVPVLEFTAEKEGVDEPLKLVLILTRKQCDILARYIIVNR